MQNYYFFGNYFSFLSKKWFYYSHFTHYYKNRIIIIRRYFRSVTCWRFLSLWSTEQPTALRRLVLLLTRSVVEFVATIIPFFHEKTKHLERKCCYEAHFYIFIAVFSYISFRWVSSMCFWRCQLYLYAFWMETVSISHRYDNIEGFSKVKNVKFLPFSPSFEYMSSLSYCLTLKYLIQNNLQILWL